MNDWLANKKGSMTMEENKYWGFHLAVEANTRNPSIRDAAAIYKFGRTLLEDIDMNAYGAPQVAHFGSGNKTGYTLVQLIETSNICGHFCDDTGDFYLDVFSCKPFSIETVLQVIETYFAPQSVQTHYFVRQAHA